MKALCIHAHFDDFEFFAGGLFTRWKQSLGDAFQGRIIVCTECRAGHHFRTLEETGRMRREEQEASARIGDYEFKLLTLPDGRHPREACLLVTPDLLAALWKAIRDFEPDYLICPPLATHPLAGIHNDHETVAQAVRRVAYMINVPHAFIEEYPADETKSVPCKVPVILNAYDPYQFGANDFDLIVDVEEAFETVARMTWCHQSQITEWLPWVGRHQLKPPKDFSEWEAALRARYVRQNKEMGLNTPRGIEAFTVTAWGEIAGYEQLLHDLPGIDPDRSRLDALKKRLKFWGTGER